ncbi:MAG TPA: hypothetical protein VEL74_05040 [Thermoanaerobaculia bacterium]|nr:hypothetical protein [Thermoanaerobaculia bacterium]
MIRRLITGPLLLILAVLAAAPAAAQLVPLGREQRVDTSATAGYCPALAADAGGGFTVAWANTQDESIHSCTPAGRLYTRTYDRDGTAEAPPFLAVRAGDRCVYDLRVGTAPGEEPLFTWREEAGKYGGHSVAVARSGGSEHSLRRGVLVPLPSGDFVTLLRASGNGRRGVVVERRHDPEEEGRSFLAGINGGADAAEMPDGGLVIVWSQGYARRIGVTVHGRRFDADGRPLGPAFLISGNDFASSNREVMVAANEAGQFVVTWTSIAGPVSSSYAMARAYGSDGQPASPVLRVSPRVEARQSQRPSRPAIDEQGRFVVLWRHYDARNPAEAKLSARMFEANGRRLGPELRLADWSPVSGCAGVASLEDGRWVMAWGRHPFYADASGIYLQRFTSE